MLLGLVVNESVSQEEFKTMGVVISQDDLALPLLR